MLSVTSQRVFYDEYTVSWLVVRQLYDHSLCSVIVILHLLKISNVYILELQTKRQGHDSVEQRGHQQ